MSPAQAADHTPFTADQTSDQILPDPLVRSREEPKPLPLDHIGPLKAPVKAIAALTSAPIEIAFQSVLAAASLATQHICNVETLAGPAPLSLFLLTVATSGERKSSCDKLATVAIQDWEEENWEQYLQTRKEFEIAHAAYETRGSRPSSWCNFPDGLRS